MANRPSSWLSRPFALRSLLLQARLAIRLIREPRVPMLPKVVPVLAALYVIAPIDLVPDVLPVLGQLDDLGVVLAALELFLRLCPAAARSFHREAIVQGRPFVPMPASDGTIEAEWRHG